MLKTDFDKYENAISRYREAYLTHRNGTIPNCFSINVQVVEMAPKQYKGVIYDVWIEPIQGNFRIIRNPVPGGNATSSSTEGVMEALLNRVRTEFTDDKMFNKIKI